MMTENNISNVLNVSCTCERPLHLDDEHFHRIAVRDNYQEKITPFLDEAVRFIGQFKRSQNTVSLTSLFAHTPNVCLFVYESSAYDVI